jgi:hypothetical protein
VFLYGFAYFFILLSKLFFQRTALGLI